MPALTTVVAAAVSCSVLFIVSAVVGTVVWVRIRKERLSMAVANARHGRFARGLQNFPADTVTELSREEGSALRQYGQLPYGRPTEWGLLASNDSLALDDNADSETGSFKEKARSLKRSLSLSRSKSKLSKMARPRRLSSLATLTETSEKPSLSGTREGSKDDIYPISAVEGVMELPTETTPRQTPDREFELANDDTSIRPISGLWPLLNQREHSSALYPVFEDPQSSRIRGGSITTQTAGSMPDQPVPPPPVAFPPSCYTLPNNDSLMRMSSLSLETADSSILEEAMRGPASIDGEFASPNLPPCPTFMPYSANDVGRNYVSRQGSLSRSLALSTNSLLSEASRLEPDRTSPRRSQTARTPSFTTERVSPPPRRSESLSTTQSKKDSRFGSLGPTPVLYPTPLSTSRGSMNSSGLLPHFSQMQRHSAYDSRQNDPFYGNSVNQSNCIIKSEGPGRKPTSFIVHETPLNSDGLPRAPLPSAMKGGTGLRKGHRRQNCVRISIHPPLTFGRPAFSPTAEEPEELEEFDMRQSEVSSLSASNMSPYNSSSVSPISMRTNYQDPPRGRRQTNELSSDDHRGSSYRRASSRKKKLVPTESIDSTLGRTESAKDLPDLITTLPSTEEANMTCTPSPDKPTPGWMGRKSIESPTTYENSPSTGSPRRPMIKGPRSQPGKFARNPQRSSASIPLGEYAPTTSTPSSPSGRPSRPRRTSSKDSRRSNGSVHRANSDATEKSVPRGRDRNDVADVGNVSVPSQPPPCGLKKAFSTHSSNIVTIWEDQHLERSATQRSSISQLSGPAELQGDSSPMRVDRDQSTKSADRLSRQDMKTPTGKTVGLGLGIGCAPTPASLYDGDGFLKE